MSPSLWIDGSLVPEEEAVVSALDHGLTVGDGVFETLRVYRGVPFALSRHLVRLGRSCDGLGLPCPPEDVLRGAVSDVVAASDMPEARLRITVTGGRAPLGSGRGTSPPTVIVALAPFEEWPASVQVATVPWPRNEHSAVAGLKTTSYAENVVALAAAHAQGASEAIFGNTAGNLCEGTGSNVFLVIDDRIVTPPLDSGCLAGVTRELLLELVDIEERDVPLWAITEAEEVFITSSTREVQPVSAVDGMTLSACPGPRTREAAAALTALIGRELDP